MSRSATRCSRCTGICGTSRWTWPSSPSGVVLFVIALGVFGRLEGNFAEEL